MRGLTYISHHRLQVSVVMRHKNTTYIHPALMKDHMKMELMMTYELSSESIICAIKNTRHISLLSRVTNICTIYG